MEDILSIIIPVYNVKQYLSRCLDSVISQTYKNLEIICVNDGSTDGSDHILNQYAQKDNRIKILNQSNKGMAAARNAGIKIAKGKYITFVDSDDYINPEMYGLCLPLFNNYNIDVVIFSAKIVIEKDGIDWKDDNYFQVKQEGLVTFTPTMLIWENVSCWNKVYKAEIIHDNKIQFPDGLWYEDLAFYWKYMTFVKNAYFLKNQLYNYVRRSGSIMHCTFLGNEKSIEHLAIYDHLLSFWLSNSKFKEFINEVGAKLFEKYFHQAYIYAPYEIKKKLIIEAEKLTKKYKLDQLFSENEFIKNLINSKLYLYNWINEYTPKQKLFSIKKFKYEKVIHIFGLRLEIKRKNYRKIQKMLKSYNANRIKEF